MVAAWLVALVLPFALERAAHAGPGDVACEYAGFCSGTDNRSDHEVLVGLQWCGNDSSGGPCYDTAEAILRPGQDTPDDQDWDGLFIRSFCAYEGRIHRRLLPDADFYALGGPDGYWFHVSSSNRYEVRHVTCNIPGGGDPPDQGGIGTAPPGPDAPTPPNAPNPPPAPPRSAVAMLGNGIDNASVDLLRAASQGSRFSPIVNGRHAPGFGWSGMKVVAGDFNGDGRMDVGAIGAGVDGSSIDLLVALATSDGHYGALTNWRHAPGLGFSGLKVIAGDFNGDGKWDIAALGNGVNNASVDLLVATSTGSGFNGVANWRHAEGFGWGGMNPIAGDFNGDGRWDFGAVGAGINNTSIDLLVATSTGSGFNGIANWRHAEGFGWGGIKPVAGDFNGDGRWDFGAIGAGVNNSSVDFLVATSTGSSFNGIANWRHAEGYGWAGMKPVAGDFNGDGKWDIGAIGSGIDNTSIDLLVALSHADQFNAVANWLHAAGYGWGGLAAVSL